MANKYFLENHCYALPDIDKVHPIAYDRHDFSWYPERGMCLTRQMLYRPYVKSIVTESPWLIAMYPRENVLVWDQDDGRGWINPDIQTYGASVNGIMMNVLGFNCTIPAMALDGGESLRGIIKKIGDTY